MEWVKIFTDRTEATQHIKPGIPRLLVVHNKRICLTLFNNAFYAVQDTCSHNHESLSKGHINFRGELICPLHNYCFDLLSGRESHGRSVDLVTYPIKLDESGFFIGI